MSNEAIKIETAFEQIALGVSENGIAKTDFLFNAPLLERLKTKLLKKINAGELKQAGTGNRGGYHINKAVRGDKILWLGEQTDDADEKDYLETIDQLSAYLNRTCFAGINSAEFHYACYEPGAFYKRHLDRFRNDDSRKLSVITYLNTNWQKQDGGELYIYLNGITEKIIPLMGRTVVFRSHLLEHEVRPAIKARLSITGWLK